MNTQQPKQIQMNAFADTILCSDLLPGFTLTVENFRITQMFTVKQTSFQNEDNITKQFYNYSTESV